MPGFQFLEFTPGKDDVTVVYHSDEVNTLNVTGPGWIIGEGNESGGIDSSIALVFSEPATTPAVVAPTAAGYSIAWQNSEGAWLGIYTSATNKASRPYAFAPSSGFGGANLQPPLVALTPFGPDYGVLFQRPRDAELWRVDGMGNRRSGALVFPSALGNLGTVSTVEATSGGGLAATYADYTVADGSAGDRLFVNATCY